MFKLNKKDNQDIEIKISFETFLKLGLFIAALYFSLSFFHKAAHALFLIALSVFLALALNAPVHFLSTKVPGKKKGSRVLGTAIAYLVVVILLASLISFIVPPLVRQTNKFVSQAPSLISDYKTQSGFIGDLIRKYHLEGQVNSISVQLASRVSHFSGTAFKTIGAIGSSIFATITVLVLTFMMLIEGPRWVKFIKDVVPGKRQSLVAKLLDDMYKVIRGFVNGQVLLSLIATVLITPALFILHIRYPLALILVVFICGLVPLIGHTIGAVIISSVALFNSLGTALIILTYYILYLQFENYVIQPKVQANSTNMSPFLVFSAVLIGVSFGGILGGLLAIPLAGCIRILILEYLRSRNLINNKTFAETTAPETNS